MDWLVDLESTCSALGTADGKEYVRDEQCEEGVKDLVRFVSFTSWLSLTDIVLHYNIQVLGFLNVKNASLFSI